MSDTIRQQICDQFCARVATLSRLTGGVEYDAPFELTKGQRLPKAWVYDFDEDYETDATNYFLNRLSIDLIVAFTYDDIKRNTGNTLRRLGNRILGEITDCVMAEFTLGGIAFRVTPSQAIIVDLSERQPLSGCVSMRWNAEFFRSLTDSTAQ